MNTTIATSVPAGSFFDLGRKDPELLRLREEGAESALPFALMERLIKSGIPYAQHARSLRSENVTVAGVAFDWFDAQLPGEIANEINLTNYEIAEHTDDRRAALSEALDRLSLVHPEGFARVREFVRGLLWVGLKPGVRASSLTSSSDPALPYIVVFSDKARHHIPPNTVSPEPSPASWRRTCSTRERTSRSASTSFSTRSSPTGTRPRSPRRSRSSGERVRASRATSSGRWTGPSTRPVSTTSC